MSDFEEQVIHRMSVLETTTKSNSEMLKVLFRSLEGNGQPGIKQRLTELEAEHKQCMQMRSEEKKPKLWVHNTMAICAIITCVIILVEHYLGG